MAEAADLALRVLRGDVRAVARAISIVEDGAPGAPDLARALYAASGRSIVVGITGPPGVGKSTLVDALTAHLRRQNTSVGIVAVDPTSPYSGGAILGDRIRMQAHAADAGVFIRSMATRGHAGGLAAATGRVVTVLAASGKDVVLVETVGVGQDETEIIQCADVNVVVLVPGLGDDVQALKAGLMEVADVFVVNKADRDGAERLRAEIEGMLSLSPPDPPRPAIVSTVAVDDQGVDELLRAVLSFHQSALASGLLDQRRRVSAERQLEGALKDLSFAALRARALDDNAKAALLDRLAAREVDPLTAAEDVLRKAGL